MASTGFHPFPMDNTYLQHSLSIDSRRSFFDDDESILDENILDNSLLDSSTTDFADRRRGSAYDANAIFSPANNNDWDFDHDMGIPAGPADDSTPVSAATFEHSNGTNNPFIKLEQAQPAYAQPHNTWSSGNAASGSCTPTVYDNGFSNGPFDDNSYLAPAMPGPAQAFESVHIPPHAVFTASVPSSPAIKDWSQAGPNDHGDSHAIKRMRPSSPAPRSHSPLHVVRRDGIRKKNARFDIPAERTLMNIDQLIARSQDENEIKELKQQKRLLRNRQAALDSRQRKKQHTERLEEEKKLHNAVITELEDKLSAMTMREEKLHQTLADVVRERDYLAHKTEAFIMEKEEMVRSHTLETGELRKKNTYLSEQLQKMQDAMDRTPMAHQPSSSGFSDGFNLDSDFDLEGDCWSDPMSIQSPEMLTTKERYSEPEKPVPGLLFILLLCGALVASSKASSPALPPLPKQLQTASASVLQNIFQEAGVSETRVTPVDTSRTSDAWAVAKSEGPQMVGLDSSMAMLNCLGKPTTEQQRAQFMELTPAEYNDVTSTNFLREPEPTVRQGRSRIEETLAARSNNGDKPSVAEVYTRSLLWDRVDAEVVRRFAAFARQAQDLPATSNDDGGAAANS